MFSRAAAVGGGERGEAPDAGDPPPGRSGGGILLRPLLLVRFRYWGEFRVAAVVAACSSAARAAGEDHDDGAVGRSAGYVEDLT